MTTQATVGALPVSVSTVSKVVARVVQDYLDDLHSTVPGLVDGVYLTGSVPLGDFHPASSDIDFVTVVHDVPDATERMLLADVHERMAARRPQPPLDGYYLRWDDLAAPPDPRTTLGLRAVGGVLHYGSSWVPSILTWQELSEHGLHLHGPGLERHVIAQDPGALREWCFERIETDWTPWWYRSANLWSRAGLGSLGTWSPASGVLGLTRLHYLLTSGQVTSRCGAGEWALTVCEPQWRRLLGECLRIRNRPTTPSLYPNPIIRRREALTFMDLLMTATEEAFGVDLDGTYR